MVSTRIDTPPLQIAIDGPASSGKSTTAKLLAETLNLVYVDTGAMYRGVAWAAKEHRIDWEDKRAIEQMVETVAIELENPNGEERDGRPVTVLVNGEDVSWKIRSAILGEGASVVSQYPKVREVLVKRQQEIAKGRRVVMEGRDIGTRVLPEASLKIYMHADLKQRAKWKRAQLEEMGEKDSLQKVRADLNKRDTREMSRKVDPLRKAEGAWDLNTTDLTIDEVVSLIVKRVRSLEGLTEE